MSEAYRPLIIGHRGAPRICPENTLPSFARALELGVDGLELDVQLTKDDELVVIHDETVDRTTEDETGLVRSFSLAQLKRMDFGARFDSRFAGVRIPLLREVLDLIRERTQGGINRIHLDIELKTGIVAYPGIEEKVIELVHAYGYHNVQLSSFYHQSLVTAKEVDPTIPTGILYMSGLYEPWKYAERLGAQYVNPSFQAWNPEFFKVAPQALSEQRQHCASCNQIGIRYFPWTVDTEAAMAQMFMQKVDGIISNRPDVALALRDATVPQL